MSEYLIQDTTLTDIADAIRGKTGGSALITPEDMATEIESIQTGGGSRWIVSGDIEFTDQFVNTITFPIDCPFNTAELTLIATKSGVVENGAVIEDAILTSHITQNEIFGWKGRTYDEKKLPPRITVGGASFSGTYSKQLDLYYANTIVYGTKSLGININTLLGGTAEGTYNARQYLDTGSLVISTGYNTYVFCNTGIYKKFHYEIVAWDE